ncbi:Mrp/NBP35 family ATP-binding protein [Clostridium sediminicola]|uniref:Mrp/NBP35 family ATP-binding protein n=1 Tax=Clostridium sediminicola TaxID=3114879 RepID=UPI0031F1E0BE
MSNCETCPSKGSCNEESCGKTLPKFGNIKNIIGVISGKGGVGKSTVTGILAIQLAKMGYKVGVLDADITGPSMPRIFAVNEERAKMEPIDGQEQAVRLFPVESSLGIKIMSLNLLMEKEDHPVIWRGPMITGVLNQMYADSEWGELDYLLIDMPPGTGDIALTVMQTIPLSGMVVVSTPQDMVSMIVKKVIYMVEKLNIKLLGTVENMSYVQCGKCGERIKIFSKKSASEHAEYLGIPLLEEMPIDLELVDSLENGKFEDYIKQSDTYETLIENTLNRLR